MGSFHISCHTVIALPLFPSSHFFFFFHFFFLPAQTLVPSLLGQSPPSFLHIRIICYGLVIHYRQILNTHLRSCPGLPLLLTRRLSAMNATCQPPICVLEDECGICMSPKDTWEIRHSSVEVCSLRTCEECWRRWAMLGIDKDYDTEYVECVCRSQKVSMRTIRALLLIADFERCGVSVEERS